MNLDFTVYKLELKKPLSVSRETHRTHHTVLVRLHEGGMTGYGEATEFHVYGAKKENILVALKKASELVQNIAFSSPQTLWNKLQPHIGVEPFALCALDMAAWDLWAKQQNQPLRNLLGSSTNHIETSMTLGLSTPEELDTFLCNYAEWPRIKLKLGNQWDIENIKQLSSVGFGRHNADVNAGWNVEHARAVLSETQKGGLKSLEQPLAIGNFSPMKLLRDEFPHQAYFADEDFRSFADLENCAKAYDGVNLKLMKCGGITPALHLLESIRSMKLKASIGCMPESSIGASAIAHLAHLFDYADFDSIEFMANDPFSGVKIRNGMAEFPDALGLGVSQLKNLKWQAL